MDEILKLLGFNTGIFQTVNGDGETFGKVSLYCSKCNKPGIKVYFLGLIIF